jgi:hypothetical protein
VRDDTEALKGAHLDRERSGLDYAEAVFKLHKFKIENRL